MCFKIIFASDSISDTKAGQAEYIRIDPEDVHVTTMDEVEFDSESFGMYGVFEVSLDGNNVTAYYGSYWWD